MRFWYQVRTREGKVQSGVIEATSKETALALLQKKGYFVTFLEPERAPIYARELKIFKGISQRELTLFTRQLATMVTSEVPIVESLKTLANQTTNSQFREVIFDLSEQIKAGTSFSKALLAHQDIFSPFYIAVVKAGEMAGKLSHCLNYLANHLEREYLLASKIRGALIYPAFILVLFILVFGFMIFSVFPNFSRIFAESGIEAPFITQFVLSLTEFLKKNFAILSLGTIVGIVSFFYYAKSETGKKKLGRVALQIPFLGPILKYTLITRFSENLATLFSAGIMITDALGIVEGIIGNEAYREAISQMKEEVKKGAPISSVSNLFPHLFPPFFNQMVKIGEKTGKLSDCLMTIANFFQSEVERKMESFVRILEPLLIVGFGVLVGGLVASVIIPLYRIIGGY